MPICQSHEGYRMILHKLDADDEELGGQEG
jgi:hypothetical protein